MLTDKYTKYADDVLADRIKACKYIKKACERFYDFAQKYEFRDDKVDKVVDFISHLKHYQGKHKGERFKLEPWQVFVVANIFGWYHKDTGRRVTNSIYLQLARKNGKTALIAAIALYCLVADGESGAEVDCIANSVKQSHLLFDMSKHFANDIDPKHKHFQRLRDTLKFPKTDSIMQVQASDSANLDGYNPSCFVLDEVHSYKDSQLYDVMVSGQGMRSDPLGILITTAGFSLTGFCFIHRQMCIDILYGLNSDDSQFSLIYELDQDDNWDDPKQWVKPNPNLGVTVQKEYLEREVNRAKNNTALKTSLLTKNFNVWIPDAVDTWIPDQYIVEASKNIPWSQFNNRVVYIGGDLSTVSDLSVITYMTKYLNEQTYYFKSDFYLPESALTDNVNCETYKLWNRQGLLHITPGNVIDYEYILNDILLHQKDEEMLIDTIGVDPYNATSFQIEATSAGLPIKPFPQSIGSFNRPTKEFERLVRQGRAIIDNNIITRWCFANAVLKTDVNGNQKPQKRGGPTSMKKIDACITHAEALGTYLNSDNAKYEETDMTV